MHGATARFTESASLIPSSLKIKLIKSKFKIPHPAFTGSGVRGEVCRWRNAELPVLGYLEVAQGPGQSRVGAELLFSPCIRSIYPTLGRKEQSPGTAVRVEARGFATTSCQP